MLFFSPTQGFLSSVIHGNAIPADAIEISTEQRDELLIGQSAGQRVSVNDQGTVVILESAGPTAEQLAAAERAWRDTALAAAEGLRDRHRDQLEIGGDTTLTANEFTELLLYMQALRDWPQSSNFPDSAARPIAPEWMA